MIELLQELFEVEERIDWEAVSYYAIDGISYIFLDTCREAAILVRHLEQENTRRTVIKTRDRTADYAVFD